MRKILFLVLALTMSSVAQAGVGDAIVFNGSYLYGLNKNYTIGGKQYFSVEENSAVSENRGWNVYDSNFNSIRYIQIPYIELEYIHDIYQRQYEYRVTGIEGTSINNDGALFVPGGKYPYTDAKNVARNYGYQEIINKENGATWFVLNYLYLNGKFYTEYPCWVLVYENSMLNLMTINYSTEYGPYGEWDVRHDEGTYHTSFHVASHDLDYETESISELTQCLFNNDENFEFLTPVKARMKYSIGHKYEDDLLVYYRDIDAEEIVGFNVESDNGTTLFTVMFPEGFILKRDYYANMYLMKAGEEDYIMANSTNINDSNGYILLYKIDKAASNIQKVAMLPCGAVVSPNNVRRSESVNINLDKSSENDCIIYVVRTNGSIASTSIIKAGETHTQISTDNLPSGMYIVNVSDGNSVKENCKIIVR